MIRHITLMKLKDFAEGHDAQYNFQQIKTGMEALVGQIDGLTASTAQLGFSSKFDVCVTTDFEDEAAQQRYGAHPAHQAMREYIHKVVEDNRPAFDCVL